MAAFSTTFTAAISNISTGLPQRSSLAFPHKISRVCFTTFATNNPDQGSIGASFDNAANKAIKDIEATREKGKEIAQELKELASELAENTANKLQEAEDNATQIAHETEKVLKEKADDINEQSKEVIGSIVDNAEKSKKSVVDAFEEAKDKTDEIKEIVVGKSD